MIDILEKYQTEGLLSKQFHPKHNLIIWNYTPRVQYEKLWDDVTLRCRGLITDTNGKVIVQPFKKFFNYEEVVNETPINNDYVYIQEKIDGSLGILFFYEDEWIMSTRGSFTSEQSQRGLEILKKKYKLQSFEPSIAYLVEIIYPENRIVVNYNQEKIVFLSTTLNHSFNWEETKEDELHWTTSCAFFKSNGIKKEDIVETKQFFNFSDELYRELKEKNEENKEGYVLKFFPSNFRVKIKFEEYVRLHKIVTNISNRDIWEYLKEGKSFDEILDKVPDEFYNWVKETKENLIFQFNKIENEYKWIFNSIKKVKETSDRKVFATYALNYKYPSILFNMNNGKDHKEIIWKIIYPNYSKPFKKEYDEENLLR
jgi:RNA ligase